MLKTKIQQELSVACLCVQVRHTPLAGGSPHRLSD